MKTTEIIRRRGGQNFGHMKMLLLPMLFLLLCACTPSATKPTASVTGSEEPDAVKEDQRHVIAGLGPR